MRDVDYFCYDRLPVRDVLVGYVPARFSGAGVFVGIGTNPPYGCAARITVAVVGVAWGVGWTGHNRPLFVPFEFHLQTGGRV